MKIILILLAVFAYSVAVEVDPFASRSISSSVVNVIEGIKNQMPCGFPGKGIPPLAPLKIPHKEININTTMVQLNGTVDNLSLNGLNDFDISEMKVSVFFSRINFRVGFKNVNVDTLYDLNAVLKKAGFTINVKGKGPAKFAIKDMNITGIIKYSLSIFTGKLKLKTLQLRTHINATESDIQGILGEGEVNQKMNNILAEAITIAVNGNEETITNKIEKYAVPIINEALSKVSLGDLIGGGGGGASGGAGEGAGEGTGEGAGGKGEVGEKQKCVPPKF